MHQIRKFKRGAASFYIVAISTLILVIVAASFATVIISEVTRTSNDDLSQSAYDSALAGVEDAKLVLHNYQQCKAKALGQAVTYDPDAQEGQVLKCEELVNWIEKGTLPSSSADQCDVLPYALSRSIERGTDNEKLGVLVQEGNDGENDMQQYYTCVKIASQTDDVLGKLNSQNPEESFRIKFADANAINTVKYVRLNWHVLGENADSDRVGTDYMNIGSNSTNSGIFRSEKPTPAVVSLAMVQSDAEFNFEELSTSQGSTTDRGTLYFVPTDNASTASNTANGSYTGIYGGSDGSGTAINLIDAQNGFVKSNDKGLNQGSGSQNYRNLPFVVLCGTGDSGYICSANAEIPAPVGGARNPETFVFSVALPYGDPETQFSLEFYDSSWNRLKLDGVQISVDSTGRANDLFRRIDTRLKPADASYPYPIYGIQALNPYDSSSIWKNFYSTCEYNFVDPTC